MGTNQKIKHKCLVCGHEWDAAPSKLLIGRGCPNCFKRFKTSFPEQAIYYYVKQTYPDAINRHQDIERQITELDIFVPSLSLGIEYDGQVWHKNKDRDQKKYKICRDNNIDLIRVSEFERDNYNDICDQIFYTIPCDSNDYTNLTNVIKKLFSYLGVNSLDIDCDRDSLKIKEQYYTILKENSLESKSPERAKYWDYEKNENITPQMVANNSNDKYWFECKDCGISFKVQVNVFSHSQGWCKKCSMKNGVLKVTSIPVYSKELDMAFSSETSGANYVGISNSTITAFFRRNQKYAGKHPVTGQRLTWERWTLEQYEEWCKSHNSLSKSLCTITT